MNKDDEKLISYMDKHTKKQKEKLEAEKEDGKAKNSK